MQFPAKVHCPLPSPAVGYVTDVGGPAGQEDLTGIEGLSLLCCSSEHLDLRLGYCICGGAAERSGLLRIIEDAGESRQLSLSSIHG